MKQFDLFMKSYKTADSDVKEILKHQMYGYIRALKDLNVNVSDLEEKYQNL